MQTNLTTGSRVYCTAAFTSPIGAHFLKGDAFIVELVGSVNTRLRHERTGSVVWITDGYFITKEHHDGH